MFWANASISNVRSAMLFEHAPTLPEGEDWEYGFSWPGERVLAMKDGAGVRLISVFQRRDLTNRFPVVAAMVAKARAETVVIDGVIRAVESRQWPAFANAGEQAIQAGGAAPIRLIGMDLLWRNGMDLRPRALPERRARLHDVTEGTGVLEPRPPSAPVAGMLAEASRLGSDGVIARRRQSRYRPFARSGDWVRVVVNSESDTRRPSSGPGEVDRTFGFDGGALSLGQMA